MTISMAARKSIKEKDMEAGNVKHQRELEAAATREEQLHEKETELRAQINHKETKTLSNSLKELQSEKNAGVNVAEWDAQDLKGQLEELRSHHNNFGPTYGVCFCTCNSAVGTTPSDLYIFQGTTSEEVGLSVNTCQEHIEVLKYSIGIEEKQAHVVPVYSKIRLYPSAVTNPGRWASKCKCYPHEMCDECMPKHN